MKKSLFFALVLPTVFYAQSGRVGINTTDPNATLKVNTTENDTAKGILIPRLTAEAVKMMTGNNGIGEAQNSLLVFVSAGFSNAGDQTRAYANINAKGFYYWDFNTKSWKKIMDSDAPTGGGSTYEAGEGMFLTGNVFHRKGLEEVSSQVVVNGEPVTKKGWRYIGAPNREYAPIGRYATDLSFLPTIPKNPDDETEKVTVTEYSQDTGEKIYDYDKFFPILKWTLQSVILIFPLTRRALLVIIR